MGAIQGCVLIGAISQQAAASVSGLRGNSASISDLSKQLFGNLILNDARLKKSLRVPRYLPGINLNHNEQIILLKKLIYEKELKDLNLTKSPKSIYDFDIRGAFKFGDAEFLYH